MDNLPRCQWPFIPVYEHCCNARRIIRFIHRVGSRLPGIIYSQPSNPIYFFGLFGRSSGMLIALISLFGAKVRQTIALLLIIIRVSRGTAWTPSIAKTLTNMDFNKNSGKKSTTLSNSSDTLSQMEFKSRAEQIQYAPWEQWLPKGNNLYISDLYKLFSPLVFYYHWFFFPIRLMNVIRLPDHMPNP